jgi:hypothetical protein
MWWVVWANQQINHDDIPARHFLIQLAQLPTEDLNARGPRGASNNHSIPLKISQYSRHQLQAMISQKVEAEHSFASLPISDSHRIAHTHCIRQTGR